MTDDRITLVDMVPGDMAFAIPNAPDGVSDMDGVGMRRAVEILTEALAILEAPRRAQPLPRRDIDGDCIMPLPGTPGRIVLQRENDNALMDVSLSGSVSELRCRTRADWTDPKPEHFVAGVRLFLTAALGGLDREGGDRAARTIEEHAIAALADGNRHATVRASTPWRIGRLTASSMDGSKNTTAEIRTPHAAGIICTSNTTTMLTILPLAVGRSMRQVDAVAVMRAVARTREREQSDDLQIK